MTLVAVSVPVTALWIPSSAVAVQHHPQGAFAVFADCPLSNPVVVLCMAGQITGGEFVLGKKLVPISKPIALQGGLVPARAINEYVLAGAEDGNTLGRVALSVPGGLGAGGLTSRTEVTVTPELAASASSAKLNLASLLFEEGVALALPLKVKLDNSLLGSNCYVGREANPIVLELTDGTTSPPPPNHPITGSAGKAESVAERGLEITVANGASLVDNSFSAPEATGCGGGFGASLVDSFVGLPSRPGYNTAILHANIDLTQASEVRASERTQPSKAGT